SGLAPPAAPPVAVLLTALPALRSVGEWVSWDLWVCCRSALVRTRTRVHGEPDIGATAKPTKPEKPMRLVTVSPPGPSTGSRPSKSRRVRCGVLPRLDPCC